MRLLRVPYLASSRATLISRARLGGAPLASHSQQCGRGAKLLFVGSPYCSRRFATSLVAFPSETVIPTALLLPVVLDLPLVVGGYFCSYVHSYRLVLQFLLGGTSRGQETDRRVGDRDGGDFDAMSVQQEAAFIIAVR